MTSRCPICRNEGRNRTCHPVEDEVSRDNVAPTDPRVPADTSAPQLLRDALYDLRTHSHQPPNGADMPIEYVAFRDVEDLLSRAAALRSEDAAPTCCELACYEDPGCACDGCRSEDAAPQPDPQPAYPHGHGPEGGICCAPRPDAATARPSPAATPSVAPQSDAKSTASDDQVSRAPQSLRDALEWALLRVAERGYRHPDECSPTECRCGFWQAAKALETADRAALDAPALTVERLRDIIDPVIGEHIGGPYPEVPFRALSQFESALVAAILRALGEGAGEGVDRG